MPQFSWIASMATPEPSPVVEPDPVLVTPGFLGFAIVALLVIAVIALVWDMQRRLRRSRYRAEIDAELDAEQRAAASEDPRVTRPAPADSGGARDEPGSSARE